MMTYCSCMEHEGQHLTQQLVQLFNTRSMGLGLYLSIIIMSEQVSSDSLKYKITQLKTQLSSCLDKTIRLTDMAHREKLLDHITGFKRELEHLSLKLDKSKDKDKDTPSTNKDYNQIALKVNALQAELDLKQTKHLWNKENRRRQPKDTHYEDLLEELVEKDDKLKTINLDISCLKKQNRALKEEYEELEESLKIIMNKQAEGMTEKEDLQHETHALRERIRELQSHCSDQLEIIEQLRGLEKENLSVYQKGACEIHRLAKVISCLEERVDSSQGELLQRENTIQLLDCRLLKMQQMDQYQLGVIEESRRVNEDLQLSLNSCTNQLYASKQAESCRDQENELIRGHLEEEIRRLNEVFEAKIQEVNAFFEDKVSNLRQEYQQKVTTSLIEITALTSNIEGLKQQIILRDRATQEASLRYEQECIRLNSDILKWVQLYKEKEQLQQLLITETHQMQSELSIKLNTYEWSTTDSETQVKELKMRVHKDELEVDRLKGQLRIARRENENMASESKMVDVRVMEVQNQREKYIGEIEMLKGLIRKEKQKTEELRDLFSQLQEKLEDRQHTIDTLMQSGSESSAKLERVMLEHSILVEERESLSGQLQHSHRLVRETEADNIIQYQQEIKHNQIISCLRGDIAKLELLKHHNELEIQELMTRIHSFQELNHNLTQELSSIRCRSFEKSTMNTPFLQKTECKSVMDCSLSDNPLKRSSRDVKIRVLEDIKKIINTME